MQRSRLFISRSLGFYGEAFDRLSCCRRSGDGASGTPWVVGHRASQWEVRWCVISTCPPPLSPGKRQRSVERCGSKLSSALKAFVNCGVAIPRRKVLPSPCK